MASLWTDGAEFGDVLFWDTPSTLATTTTNPRSGVYCYTMGGYVPIQKNIPNLTEFYLRAAWRESGYSTDYRSPGWMNGATELGSVRVNVSTHFVEIYTGTGTLVDTGTIALTAGTMYLIEVHVKIDDTVGAIDVKIDGIADASFAGDTKPGAATYDGIWWSGASTQTFQLDDLALNDTTGGVDDSWCGDGKVVILLPNAAGDVTQLTPSAGDNYAAVDDIPHDTDTTYVESSTQNQYDLYNLSASGLSGVTIRRVWAEARARDTVAEGGLLALGLKTVSTEYWGDDLNMLTTYNDYRGTVHTINPNTLAAWTVAQLDALQVGVKVR